METRRPPRGCCSDVFDAGTACLARERSRASFGAASICMTLVLAVAGLRIFNGQIFRRDALLIVRACLPCEWTGFSFKFHGWRRYIISAPGLVGFTSFLTRESPDKARNFHAKLSAIKPTSGQLKWYLIINTLEMVSRHNPMGSIFLCQWRRCVHLIGGTISAPIPFPLFHRVNSSSEISPRGARVGFSSEKEIAAPAAARSRLSDRRTLLRSSKARALIFSRASSLSNVLHCAARHTRCRAHGASIGVCSAAQD